MTFSSPLGLPRPKLPKAPNVAAPELDGIALQPQQLEALGGLQDGLFERLQLSGVAQGEALHSRWSEVLFERCRLGAVQWKGAQWQDARFEECDLANATASHIYAARVEFSGCRMVGFHAPEASWYDLTLRGCQAGLAQFRYGKFTRARFVDCDLSGADFQNCDLRGALFENCRLRETRFSFCKLSGADIRTCDIELLNVDGPALKGLAVTPMQAALLARILGLNVIWDSSQDGTAAAGSSPGPTGGSTVRSPG